MNIKLRRSLLVLLLVSGTVKVSLAQQQQQAATDPSGNTGNQTSMSSAIDSPVPVLDGMDILLLLASGYGVYKYFQVRNRETTNR